MKHLQMGYDRIIGLLLAAFSAAMLLWIIPYGVEQMGGNVGPGLDPTFVPKLIAGLLCFLAVLLALRRPPEKEDRVRLFPPRSAVTIGFFVVYMVLTPLVGYLFASLVVLPAYLVFFGARSWKVVVPLSVLLPIGLYLFFAKVMLVMLPSGMFFE